MRKSKFISVLTAVAMASTSVPGAMSLTATAADCPVGLKMVSEKTVFTTDELASGNTRVTVYVDSTANFTVDESITSVEFKLKPNVWGVVDPINLKISDSNAFSTDKTNITSKDAFNSTLSTTGSIWDTELPTGRIGYSAYNYNADMPELDGKYSDGFEPKMNIQTDSRHGKLRAEEANADCHVAEFEIVIPADAEPGNYTINFLSSYYSSGVLTNEEDTMELYPVLNLEPITFTITGDTEATTPSEDVTDSTVSTEDNTDFTDPSEDNTDSVVDCPVGLKMIADKTSFTVNELATGDMRTTVYVDSTVNFTADQNITSVEFKLRPNVWGVVDPINLRISDSNAFSTDKTNITSKDAFNSTLSTTGSIWDTEPPTGRVGYSAYNYIDDYPELNGNYSNSFEPRMNIQTDSRHGKLRTEEANADCHIAEFEIVIPADAEPGVYTINFLSAQYSFGILTNEENTMEMCPIVNLEPLTFTITDDTDSTDPTEDITDSTDPTEDITDSTDPTEDITGSTDPTEDITDSTDPTEDITGSTDPTGDITGSTDPTEDIIGSTDPTGDITSSTDPTEDITGSTDPTEDSTSSTDPTEDSTSSTDPTEDDFLLGDANLDKKVNVRDCATIATALAKALADSLPQRNSDYNQDGKINVRDAAALAKDIALGKVGK